jgi:hypothetical protein
MEAPVHRRARGGEVLTRFRSWCRRAAPLLLAGIALVSCADARQSVQLAGGIDLLGGNTVQLDAREPLRVSVNPEGGQVCLMVRAPFRRDRDTVAIRTPGGDLVLPVAYGMREDGGADTLSRPYRQGIDEICLGAARGRTLRPPYQAVRLHAPINVSLDRVGWQSKAP